MMRKLVISVLLLSASVCQAVTIGAQAKNSPTLEQHSSLPSKKTNIKTKQQRSPVKKNASATNKPVAVEHYHHYHHYYHYPTKPANARYVRRKVYRPALRQPARIQSYRHYQPRIAYSAPIPGAGLHFVIR